MWCWCNSASHTAHSPPPPAAFPQAAESWQAPGFSIHFLHMPWFNHSSVVLVHLGSAPLFCISSGLNIHQLSRHRGLGVPALKMLLEGLGVWHLRPADRAGVDQCSFGSSLLVSSLAFLLLCWFLCILLLSLNLLLPASHGLQPVGSEKGWMWMWGGGVISKPEDEL